MRLSLSCVGGFTGPAGAETRHVDVDQLPATEAQRLHGLVQALAPAALPASLLKDRPQSSDFTYTLTIEDGASRQIRFHIGAAPPALRELVDCLNAYPRA